MKRFGALLPKHWGRMGFALLTLALLAPAPVLAFTWVSADWSRFAKVNKNGFETSAGSFTSGTVPQPKRTTSDNAKNDGGALVIDMGSYNKAGEKGKSKLVLKRTLQATADGETLNVTSFFRTLAQNETLSFSVQIQRHLTSIKGGAKQTVLVQKALNVGNTPTVVGNTASASTPPRVTSLRVRPGKLNQYTVIVTVFYRARGSKVAQHVWDNTLPAGSPHRFTFNAL